MLAELKMSLKPNCHDFGYFQSSNLQGVLMEHIDADYAQLLHEQGLNPYSQYLSCRNGWEWVVHTLTEDAYENMILPLLKQDFTGFSIKKKEIQVEIQGKTLKIAQRKELLEEFYTSPGQKYLSVDFVSPAAFKQRGRYINYPDLRLLFQSLMNRYSASSQNLGMFDEETLEQLIMDMQISRYQLRSVSFPLEGVRIPGFMGRMTLRIGGTKTLANYARMLLRFGEYSGIGIKTGMGMGAIQLSEKEKV